MNIDNIKSKSDLILFIQYLRNDLEINKQEWENPTLERFLEAMEAWLEDSDQLKENIKMELEKINKWKLVAYILQAAQLYE